MKPPCTLTPRILHLSTEISRLIGRYEGLHSPAPEPKLRRHNRICTIRGSLQIEGNTLSFEQVSAILDGKKVLGPANEILEVRNAIAAYSKLGELKPYSISSFLHAHKTLMRGLLPDAGKFRSGNVGILKNHQKEYKVSHVAPKATLVPELMQKLFDYLKSERELHPIVKSAIAHYEIEFIHPFSDGNGRMGRLWQSAILFNHHPIFEFLPIESAIKNHQSQYYTALESADKQGDSSGFVEFMLATILSTLEEFNSSFKEIKLTASDRLAKAREHFGSKDFSRRDYMLLFQSISAPTASRDLNQGVLDKQLTKRGSKNQTSYSFTSG